MVIYYTAMYGANKFYHYYQYDTKYDRLNSRLTQYEYYE
jgi:hypothetical protein